MNTAKITKSGKDWTVSMTGMTPEKFATADEAMTRANALNTLAEEATQKAIAGPLRVSVTGVKREGDAPDGRVINGGKLTAYYTDARMGRYPAFALFRDQFEVLVANWPAVVEAFEASKAQLGTVDEAIKLSRASK